MPEIARRPLSSRRTRAPRGRGEQGRSAGGPGVGGGGVCGGELVPASLMGGQTPRRGGLTSRGAALGEGAPGLSRELPI